MGTFRPIVVKCEDGTTRIEIPADWELPQRCPPLRYGHPDLPVDIAVRVRWRQREAELGNLPPRLVALSDPQPPVTSLTSDSAEPAYESESESESTPPPPASSRASEPAEPTFESSSSSSSPSSPPTPQTPRSDQIEGAPSECPSSSSMKPQSPEPSDVPPATPSGE